MTIKEFADKYDVPYPLVFDASYSLTPDKKSGKNEYSERELYRNAMLIINDRVEKYAKKTEEAKTYRNRLIYKRLI